MKSKTLSILLIVCAIALYTIAVIDVTIGNWFGAVPNFLQACVAVAVVYLLYKLSKVREVTILTTKRLADLFLMLSKGVKAELHIVNGDEDEDEDEDETDDNAPGDYKDRMVAEFNELHERWEKLGKFFETDTFKELPDEKKELLDKQHKVMGEYLQILDDRCTLEGIRLK